MELSLTNSELAFLQRLLKPYVDYYSVLAQSGRCTAENRARWEQIRALAEKLNTYETDRAA